MSRRPAPQAALSERDQAILVDVARFRFLRADQVLRLHFASGTPVGRQRRCQATLRRLTEDGYLHRHPRSIGGASSGSGRFVYQLGYRGQRVVWPARRARTPEDAGYPFVDHVLAVAEVGAELVQLRRSGEVDDLKLQLEPAVWRHYVTGNGRVLVLKPDLGIHLTVGDQQLVWLVEVDRATESLKRIRTKANQYLSYWRSGREQERLGVFPRVLWSVPDDKRADAVARALGELPDPAADMFVIATSDHTTCALVGRHQQPNEGGES